MQVYYLLPTRNFYMATPLNELSDEALIDRFRRTGEQRILSELYRRHSKAVYRKCLAIIWDKDAAQDLTHDAFVKAFLHLKKLRESSHFKAWLSRIAYHACIDYLKARKRLQLEEDWQKLENQLPNVTDMEESEEYQNTEFNLAQIEAALQHLGDADRLILVMRYYEGLSIKAIQELLGLNESAAKMRLMRARTRLTKIIQDGQASRKKT
jgi:RNA polymerase sigma-70 factor (ECF subfamily)